MDTDRILAQYKVELDRWSRGEREFPSPGDFMVQKVAEQVVDQALAEMGILLA